MVPLERFKSVAEKQFVLGERYEADPDIVQERSMNSHRHYFAALHDAWVNLPDEIGKLFPTSEHLRKYCLIEEGYTDERIITCATEDDAKRLAVAARALDGYCRINRNDTVVVIRTAKSQSHKAMGKEDFQKSKTAVLERVAQMIGVTRGELQKEAGRSA